MYEDVINKLSEDLEPVKPLKHPLLRLFPWLAIAIGYTAAITVYLGVRHDIDDKMGEAGYLFELGIAFFASVTAAASAVYASVPDMRGKSWLFIVPTTLSVTLGAWLTLRAHTEGIHKWEFDLGHCFYESLLLAFIPTALLVMLVKRGAPTRPYLAVFSVMLATSLMGWAAMRISCGIDDMGHGCVMHIFPFVVLGGVLGVLADKIFKW